MALQRALRLKKSADFMRVRQQRRSVSSRLLILAWAPNSIHHTRIGFVVSKRVARKANIRNYLKRLLSEAIRPHLNFLPEQTDIIISVRQTAVQLDPQTQKQRVAVNLRILQKELVYVLRKAHLLAPSQSGEVRQSNQA
ncbi:ribonuclease P protein component [Thermosporothrix hazakensis]|uniref:Ribonuclease P protein component n=1 Tax=Thermosporothrix hazakensis TaxID=644383 RepID=A0A326TZN0_THEHA|nr:ribonuclease P protein component [Thermosporothrix hazakensis]